MQTQTTTKQNHNWTGPILLGVFIILVYSNTFQASWQFDDFPNILYNPALHIDDLAPSSLVNTFFNQRYEDPQMSGRLYRPIANLSLALNWYFGQADATGYHVVNLLIHLLSAVLLFVTVKSLFTTPRLHGANPRQVHYIALLTVALWAANPVQTQAVTYIVQRMATLAALFYLAAMLCFMRGRQARSHSRKAIWFCGCLVSYLCAIGSKENAITLPLAIGLLEIIFFQDIGRLKSRQRVVGTLLIAGLSVFLMGLVLFIVFRGNPLDYLQRYYTERSFTLGQRIMTEPRVLLLYLSQLFYPVPERLSVVYDFQISTNLFVPWTTLPAILINAALIIVGVWQAPRRPLIAFGILFWFANHLVESTVLPLEIAFDHRNYLPSLFLFMAPSAGVVTLIDNFKHRNKILATALSAGMTVLIIAIGMGTYVRNMAWQTQKSLWQDAALKHPGLARPVQKLAEIHQQEGQLQKAVELYTRALDLRDPRPKQSRTLTLNNIGNIYYARGLYGQAIQTFEAVLQIDDDYDRARFNLAQTLVAINRLADALQQIEILLNQEADHPKFLNLKGHILIKMNRPEAALTCFRDALRSAPGNRRTLVNIGVGYSAVGAYQKADWFFKRAIQLDPADVLVLMRLIENALRADNTTAANHYLERLFKYKNALEVLKLINALENETRILPIDHHLIIAAARAYLRQAAITLTSI